MTVENKETCLRMNSAEHERQAGGRRSFNSIWKERDGASPDLLEKILDRKNLNSAYRRVKANKGAPGVDGMTVDELLLDLKEHKEEFISTVQSGKYTPQPVLRVEIPKPDGGVRKLGIPTVRDRFFQQAVTQQIAPIFEPLFSDTSYGYRPGKSAHDAIYKIRDLANEGYTDAVVLDLSKYFDTINHNMLLNLLRKQIKDERVVQIIKRFLKSGVMENGVVQKTEEGSPQGGVISPLLANIYLNEFDQEMIKRGVPCIRYADDIVLLARSPRAAERLMDNAIKFLEGKLKLKVNRDKSRVVKITSRDDFKFLGFCFGKDKNGVFVRAHQKSLKKAKDHLRELTSRSKMNNLKEGLVRIARYLRGWLQYYGIARIKNWVSKTNSWLYHRVRAVIWKHWKRVRTRFRNLVKLGTPRNLAWQAANCRRKYWWTTNTLAVKMALTKKRLVNNGFYDLADAYQSMHSSL